ncbi:MAG: hypothetical protein RIA69_00090 [Cyclobacteriaceae bacterium]
MQNYAKYLFELIAIFLAITLAYIVDEWREKQQNREETVKAIKMIQFDLKIDTNYFHLRLDRLQKVAKALEPAIDGTLPEGDVIAFRKVLNGLKANADYAVVTQGIKHLQNNIKSPTLKNDTLVTALGQYYDLSTGTGNYALFNQSHFRMTEDNYENIYSFNPHFLDSDTAISYPAIRKNMQAFLNDPYWLGRINLAYREASRNMPAVYHKNIRFIEFILTKIPQELDPDIKSYEIGNLE